MSKLVTQPVYNSDGVTLYHGDSIEILQNMPDKSIHLVFTDPPYGHGNNDGDLMGSRAKAGLENARHKTEAVVIQNDGEQDATTLFKSFLLHAKRLLVHDGCCCCCCGGGGPDPQFARWSLWMDEVLSFKQMIIWDKGWGLGWHYRRCYETILIAQKNKGSCAWFDETKAVKNIIRYGEVTRVVAQTNEEHPTEKPIELAEHFIKLHTKRGDTVLDPFLGAGSTALAAVKLGRKFIGIDIDRKFVDMAILRLKNNSGNDSIMDMRKQLKKLKRFSGRTRS